MHVLEHFVYVSTCSALWSYLSRDSGCHTLAVHVFVWHLQKGGFAQIRGSKQQPKEAEDNDDSAPQNPLSAFFGGAKKAKVVAHIYPTTNRMCPYRTCSEQDVCLLRHCSLSCCACVFMSCHNEVAECHLMWWMQTWSCEMHGRVA